MKKGRQSKIVDLIEKFEIETQEDLAEKLKDAGYQVTQATVSRDIRELNLSKISSGEGKQKYVLFRKDDTQLGDKYVRVLRDGVITVDTAQNLMVVKTVSGMAMAVAAAVDSMKMPEVLGCVGGDDTVLVVVKTQEETLIVLEYIQSAMSGE